MRTLKVHYQELTVGNDPPRPDAEAEKVHMKQESRIHRQIALTLKKETNMDKYLLRLFVTGQTPRSSRAITNLRRICEEELVTGYELEIIDVLERPQIAEDEKILATPTLIKKSPAPVRRIIGDLSDTKQVLLGLELLHQESPGGVR